MDSAASSEDLLSYRLQLDSLIFQDRRASCETYLRSLLSPTSTTISFNSSDCFEASGTDAFNADPCCSFERRIFTEISLLTFM